MIGVTGERLWKSVAVSDWEVVGISHFGITLVIGRPVAINDGAY